MVAVPNKNMRVLIVYASAGVGHRRAAEAVYEYLKANRPDLSLKIVDVLDRTNALFRFDYTVGYSFLVKYAVSLWRFAFWLTEFKVFRFISSPIATFVNNINSLNFIRYLIRKNPDYIISTHFLPADIAALLKRNKKIKSKLITIITDFGVHPYWVAEGTDLYIAASEFTRERLLKEGVASDRIKVFGLPFHQKFLKEFDRKALAEKIGINPGKFTVMLMTGSFGSGPLKKIARMLSFKAQVLVVCANNNKLRKRLLKLNMPNVKVFGFIDNTEELMAVSDCIVTKAGGSTIAEVINMDLVPIFISVIPGQESDNVEALNRMGVGFLPKNLSELKEIVLMLKNNPAKLEEMMDKLEEIKKPLACQEISGVIR
ncbi:MAG: Processive diacylglycerol beta-glucosyltransferase [Candidatus Omnitrophica bacterium ADurb.Bin205]|nr:MAG: Processive diacylglycerol beta-glucosyltransferase [Candidatus Omnitrophica bacterium ADurb.Bin205]